ncbi:MAG: hypothetical protein KGH54_02795 [Candidatus Micrarchaeota archaeon]|nr:hypothetical protein [Candidatus Micrarchaeota archaeon]
MELFRRGQKDYETGVRTMKGNITAANTNLEIANRIQTEKFDKVPMDHAIDNVHRLIEHNKYNLVLRDRVIQDIEKFQLIKDAAEVAAAKSAQYTLAKARGQYIRAIETQLSFGSLDMVIVRKMLDIELKRFEMEKLSLEKLERIREAGILHDDGSFLVYYAWSEYWDEKKREIRRESDSHNFTPFDVILRKGRNIIAVKNDIRRISDIREETEKEDMAKTLDMLEREFGISDIEKAIIVFSTFQ